MYARCRIALSLRNEDNIDPCTIELVRFDPEPFTYTGNILYEIYDEVIAVVADFVDSLLAHNRFPSVKGSAQCPECGQYFPKPNSGGKRIYCTIQCKERAKKRRRHKRQKKQITKKEK
jgi:hypothetical protein